MRVWIYARLSNDDDREMNSLQNQREICRAFAEKNRCKVVGESFDDNVSGMSFDRPGLDRLAATAEAGKLDAVIVKDMSRLGRHRTQTALFIDYLREHNVRVLSATEGLDTSRDEDDLIVGVRGLMNDYYARDIGNKIRAGYRQKHLEGLVITPPFGYWKNRNTNKVEIHPEAADTVRVIYSLYLEGHGQKEISRILNEQGRRTPAQLRSERCGRPTKYDGKPWSYCSIRNILGDEAYTGVLINHKAEIRNGKKVDTNQATWRRHEGWYPVIISRRDWEKAQELLMQQAKNVWGNQPKHRYAGLLRCGECGNAFVPMIRYWNGTSRVEYVCRGYHRNGKAYCPSHRIREERLDETVMECVKNRRRNIEIESEKLVKLQKTWALRKPILDARVSILEETIQRLEQEVDEIVMEKIQTTR